ncbi:polyamine-modulated factor 1-binding protein [Fagus crenata]
MAASASPSHSDVQLLPAPEPESQLSSLVYDISQQIQGAMENMLKMINEVDQNSAGIVEEIEKCKDSALEKKRILEEEKERFQKAAYTVLDLLNNRD